LEWDGDNDEAELWMPLLKAVARSKASLQRLSIVECDLDLDHCGSESTDCDTNDGSNVGHDYSEHHHHHHPLYTLVSRPGTTLRDLRITECQLGMAELAALCHGLQVSSCLVQRLDLSGCDLLGEACRPLANVLASSTTRLEHLTLQENIVGDVGVSWLAPALTRNRTLRTLDLKANHITATGCQHLANAFSSIAQPLNQRRHPQQLQRCLR
jgi:Leucine Rich repeat